MPLISDCQLNGKTHIARRVMSGRNWVVICLVVWVGVLGESIAQTSLHPEIDKLGSPREWEAVAIEGLPVGTKSEKAKAHLEQGMGLLASAWDFEAYRHFSAALKEDESSLMAHAGTVLSLLRADSYFKKQLSVAVKNLRAYAEVEGATAYEKNFAQGLLAMISGRPKEAQKILKNEIEPEDPSTVFNLLLSELLVADGYTQYGSPKSGQKKAIEAITELGTLHRDSPAVLSFWLMANSKNPSGKGFIKEQVLPFSRALTRMSMKFPPYHYLRGYYEQKCGNNALAIKSFLEALELYENYLEEDNLEWVHCGRVLECVTGAVRSYVSLEQYEEALNLLSKYKQKELPEEWVNSQIGKLYLWEFKTLETRVLMAKPDVEFRTLLGSLPDANFAKQFEGKSLAMLYWRALVFYLNGVELAGQKKLAQAEELYKAYQENLALIVNGREFAKQKKSLSFYERAFGAMKILEAEFKADLTLAENPKLKKGAVPWLRSAADCQQLEVSHTEPFLLYAVEERVGRHFLLLKDYEEALYYFGKGYERWLNHPGCLRGAETALKMLGRNDEARTVSAHLSRIKESVTN